MAQTKAQLLGPVVGDVTIDTNTLSLDSEDNRVGIGTSSATTKLHVKETINTAYSVTNVTDEPKNLLKLENASTTANAFSGLHFRVGSGADMFFGAIQQTANAGDFYFANQNSPNVELMRIKSSGSVGIGTDNPSYSALHISGGPYYGATLRLTNTGNTGGDYFVLSSDSSWTAGGDKLLIGRGTPSTTNTKIVLDSSGYVGIGTNSPGLVSGMSKYLTLSSTDADNAVAFELQGNRSGSDQPVARLSFVNNNSETARITVDSANGGANGNLIFTTSGHDRLSVKYDGVIQLSNLFSSYTSGTATRFSLYNDTNNHYGLHVGGEFDLNYNAGGSVLSGKGEHVFHTAAQERFRISSTGKITHTNFNGIGFQMSGSGDPTFQISDTDGTNQYVQLAHNGGDSYIVTRNNTSHGEFLVYSSNGTTTKSRLKVDDSGALTIGSGNDASSMTQFGSNTDGLTIDDVGVSNTGIKVSHGSNNTYLVQAGVNNNAYLAHYGTGDMIFGVGSTGGERLRIDPDGNIGINDTNPTSYGNSQATLVIKDDTNPAICLNDTGQTRDWWLIGQGDGLAIKYADGGGSGSASNITSAAFFKNNGNVGLGENDPQHRLDIGGSFQAKFGSSGIQWTEYANGSVIWLDGANGDFAGGDYFNIMANNSQQLTFGYAGGENIKIDTSGRMHLSNYPTNPTKAVGSPIKLRAGTGAWGISLGMRSSQNDYAYFGFTDMNGSEHMGHIYMQRVAADAGRMVFGVNDGNASSTDRLVIERTGEVKHNNITIDGYANEHDTGGYTVVTSDNHSNTFFGQNMRLGRNGTNGDNSLRIINQHATIGGGGMYLGGNGNTNAVNRIRFYVTNPNQIPGTDVTSNYHWELRPGGTTINYSFGKYIQYYTTVQNASTYVTFVAVSMMGNTAYEIRLQNSGNGISHIRCMGSHWSGGYDTIRESYLAMDAYSSVTIRDQINQTSGAQGSWSFSRPGSGQTGYQSHLVINKSAGTYGGSMTGVIIIQSHRPWELHSIT